MIKMLPLNHFSKGELLRTLPCNMMVTLCCAIYIGKSRWLQAPCWVRPLLLGINSFLLQRSIHKTAAAALGLRLCFSHTQSLRQELDRNQQGRTDYYYNYMHAVDTHNLFLFLSVLNCVPIRGQKDGTQIYL